MSNKYPAYRVLVMGLPGSGKTTFAEHLKKFLVTATRLNADEVRKAADDWDFSEAGRIRQAERMKTAADEVGGLVIADFVCPTPETRAAFDPHLIVMMDTIPHSRYPDTDAVFIAPAVVDFKVCDFNYTQQDTYDVARTILQAMPQGIMIGRFQGAFHDGHKALLDQVIERHGFCTILVRTMPVSKSNPLGLQGVFQVIQEALQDEKYKGRYGIMAAPNVAGVYYGRDVGYNVEQIELSPELQAISTTDIRKERGIKFDRERVR